MEYSKFEINSEMEKNLLRGFGSLLSVFQSFNSQSIRRTFQKSDRQSLSSDWKNVGGDLKKAINNGKVAW